MELSEEQRKRAWRLKEQGIAWKRIAKEVDAPYQLIENLFYARPSHFVLREPVVLKKGGPIAAAKKFHVEQKRGKPKRLTEVQLQMLSRMLHDHPEQCGFSEHYWNSVLCQRVIWLTFGEQYSISTCYRLLNELIPDREREPIEYLPELTEEDRALLRKLHDSSIGGKKKLSQDQLELLSTFFEDPPGRFGFDVDEWTVELCSELIWQYFGIKYSLVTCQQLLHTLAPNRDKKYKDTLSKLQEEDKIYIPLILERGARYYGFPGDNWSAYRFQWMLKKEFAIDYSIMTCSRLLNEYLPDRDKRGGRPSHKK